MASTFTIMSMPCLMIVSGPGLGRAHPLEIGDTVIGRSSSSTVRIEDTSVSREHARIQCDGVRCEIVDCDSRTGVLVNDIPVHRHTLQDRDHIRIGPVTLLFVASEGKTPLTPSEETFDVSRVARRMAAWAERWGASTLELHFQHHGLRHAVCVAQAEGAALRLRLEQRLNKVYASTHTIADALFALSSSGYLHESDAHGWASSTRLEAQSDPPSTRESLAGWQPITAESKSAEIWFCSTRTPSASQHHSLKTARKIQASAMPPRTSFLYVAIPAQAMRATAALDNIVVLHALWSREDQPSALNEDPTSEVYLERVRDSATHLLVWTSVDVLRRENEARMLFEHACRQSQLLFQPQIAPHDPQRWTLELVHKHHELLLSITNTLARCVELLGASLPWPRFAPLPEGLKDAWRLYVAKALSHDALHPLVLVNMVAPPDDPCVRELYPMAAGFQTSEPWDALRAWVRLVRVEGPRMHTVDVVLDTFHATLSFDLDVQDDVEQLTRAILYAPVHPNRHETTRAFATLREHLHSISVELEPSRPSSLRVHIKLTHEHYTS